MLSKEIQGRFGEGVIIVVLPKANIVAQSNFDREEIHLIDRGLATKGVNYVKVSIIVGVSLICKEGLETMKPFWIREPFPVPLSC